MTALSDSGSTLTGVPWLLLAATAGAVLAAVSLRVLIRDATCAVMDALARRWLCGLCQARPARHGLCRPCAALVREAYEHGEATP